MDVLVKQDGHDIDQIYAVLASVAIPGDCPGRNSEGEFSRGRLDGPGCCLPLPMTRKTIWPCNCAGAVELNPNEVRRNSLELKEIRPETFVTIDRTAALLVPVSHHWVRFGEGPRRRNSCQLLLELREAPRPSGMERDVRKVGSHPVQFCWLETIHIERNQEVDATLHADVQGQSPLL